MDLSGAAGTTFEIEEVARPIAVTRFDGEEALSALWRLTVTLASDDEALASASVVGRAATLSVPTSGEPRRVRGIVARFEEAEDDERRTTFVATLVPEVWRLTLGRTSRVFEGLSVPDVVKRVLALGGIADGGARFVLHGKYAAREHCVQYRESDWAFVARLLDEEGIFFFFDDASALVIADTPFAHPMVQGSERVPFRGARGALSVGEHVTRFRLAEAMSAGKVTMRGYSYPHPSLALSSDLRGVGDGAVEVYDHRDFDDPKVAHAELEQRAKVALEAAEAGRRTAEGGATCARLAAGAKVIVTEHPRDALNGEYLLTKVEHSFAEGGAYANRFAAIPAGVPFRTARRAPKPVVRGVQTATVVGPAGEEIHTDSFGRVRVRFHWDREGAAGEESACWVRVSQAWAGAGYGSLFVPRVGQEVVVDFLEGDLDRPIVIGGVYHGTNPTPHALPAEKTASTFKSRSTPGGAGSNELRIEDQAGSEQIYVHAQRDLAIQVEHDEERTVRHDETLVVDNDREKRVGGSERALVAKDRAVEVGGDKSERIGADESVQIGGNSQKTVTANQTETTGASRTVMVGANHTEIVGQGLTLMVGAAKSEAVTGNSTETVGADKRTAVEGDHRTTVTGASTLDAAASEEHLASHKLVTAGTRFEVVAGSSRVVIEAGGKIIVEGPDVEIRTPGAVKVRGSQLSVRATGPVQIKSAGRIDLKGRRVEVN